MTLFWQALDQVDRSYTVFVHLLGPDSQVVAQQDTPPGGGASPTSSWVPGEYITDTYRLAVKPAYPPESIVSRLVCTILRPVSACQSSMARVAPRSAITCFYRSLFRSE